MTPADSTRCTAFEGHRCIAAGAPQEVARAVRQAMDEGTAQAPLILDDATGYPLELDLRGSVDEVLARLRPVTEPAAPRGPGRPKLGVVAREVTLLPRHWDWLGRQPGGASVTLRRLVEEARRAGSAREQARLASEAADRTMRTLAGDLPGFEEASRAFWRGERATFDQLTLDWPTDVRQHLLQLAHRAWDTAATGG
jgi:hypothetical protein